MSDCELCPEKAVGRSEPTQYDDGSGDTVQKLCKRHLLMAQRRHLLVVNGGSMAVRPWLDEIERLVQA